MESTSLRSSACRCRFAARPERRFARSHSPSSTSPESVAGGVAVLARVRSPQERVAVDEDRLPSTEAGRLRLAHDLVARPLERLRLRPEPLLQEDDVSLDAEPG